MKKIHAVIITWMHQNNGHNEQQTHLLMDVDHTEVFPVLPIAKTVLGKTILKHDKNLPLAIFQANDGTVWYLTHANVTEMISKTVKTVYPDISKK